MNCTKNEKEIILSGFLKNKWIVLKYCQWTTYYTILSSDGLLFFYKIPYRKVDDLCHYVELKNYSKVEKSQSQREPFSFALIPYVSNQKIVKMAASSNDDRSLWMDAVEIIINKVIRSNSSNEFYDYGVGMRKNVGKHEPKLANSDQNYKFEISKPISVTDNLIDLNDYDDTKPGEQNDSLSINLKRNSFLLHSLSLKPDCENSFLTESTKYYNNSFNTCTDKEAFELLKKTCFTGAYMVRNDSDLCISYLEVWDDFVKLSYEIIFDGDNLENCKLLKDHQSFENITYLLHHYSHNKLPDSSIHLEIPYRLCS